MAGSFTHRRTAILAALAAAFAGIIWIGCSQDSTGPITGRETLLQGLRPAINVQEQNSDRLMAIPGVIGTAVGYAEDGRAAIRIFTTEAGIEGLPSELGGFPVEVKVTGLVFAYSDPTARQPRPVPTGVSTGHPSVTAGTIGARVRDVYNNVYALSNNHVYANQNDADLGDPALQPGAYDGGTDPADRIGTLDSFAPLDFQGGNNLIDAAIVATTVDLVGNSTPADDGYGTPSSTTAAAYVGQPVQKYGRTTGLTHGAVADLNVTINVCYAAFYKFCIKVARFVNQIGITPGTFSDGGDSGSLIVTDDANLNPVGLLFAGGSTETFANPIDPVLSAFGVTIDDRGGEPPPPADQVTDIAITQVDAPASAVVDDDVNIDVVLENVGNQDVTSAFAVTLTDGYDSGVIGTQMVGGLAHGASTTLTFPWNTTGEALAEHVLTASHDFPDDDATNNTMSATVSIVPPPAEMHVGDLDVARTDWTGRRWYANVTVFVHDDAHAPVGGVSVQGTWRVGNRNYSSSCVTLETTGSCTVSRGNIGRNRSSVTFSVNDLTLAGLVYNASQNHDPDGDSNGTTITVQRPN